ncbi:Hypothetical protein NGAL_HAMBI2605_18300 [Neorhizobium galegae bv. orientalis]|nr:Hypothetical protein NGAL_HAMBI2605_18300 [Neorhizobium galegae bv. orientalis]
MRMRADGVVPVTLTRMTEDDHIAEAGHEGAERFRAGVAK